MMLFTGDYITDGLELWNQYTQWAPTALTPFSPGQAAAAEEANPMHNDIVDDDNNGTGSSGGRDGLDQEEEGGTSGSRRGSTDTGHKRSLTAVFSQFLTMDMEGGDIAMEHM